jgi:hypothetical protein
LRVTGTATAHLQRERGMGTQVQGAAVKSQAS